MDLSLGLSMWFLHGLLWGCQKIAKGLVHSLAKGLVQRRGCNALPHARHGNVHPRVNVSNDVQQPLGALRLPPLAPSIALNKSAGAMLQPASV
eukprot:354346-Chlamydomonas_euryale.AAC.13